MKMKNKIMAYSLNEVRAAYKKYLYSQGLQIIQ